MVLKINSVTLTLIDIFFFFNEKKIRFRVGN